MKTKTKVAPAAPTLPKPRRVNPLNAGVVFDTHLPAAPLERRTSAGNSTSVGLGIEPLTPREQAARIADRYITRDGRILRGVRHV